MTNKANNRAATEKEQSHQFSPPLTLQITCLVNTALRRWEMDVDAGRTRRGESKYLKTNATGRCLAYQTERIKRTTMYGDMSTFSPDVNSFYYQPWNITSYHERVNQRRTTISNGQASRCRNWCATRKTEDHGQSSHRRRLSKYPQDAWSSRELVS